MKRLLDYISKKLPCRIISDGNTPYLERYYLTTLFGMRFYLHRFVGSDPDRGLHNHPWRWAGSVILSGHYIEETHYGQKKISWLNGLVGDSFHRVILPKGQQFVWTLFFHKASRQKVWGFMRDVDGKKTFIEHAYAKDELGRDEEWWKNAKKGKDTPNRFQLNKDQ